MRPRHVFHNTDNQKRLARGPILHYAYSACGTGIYTLTGGQIMVGLNLFAGVIIGAVLYAIFIVVISADWSKGKGDTQ